MHDHVTFTLDIIDTSFTWVLIIGKTEKWWVYKYYNLMLFAGTFEMLGGIFMVFSP